ncbi:hypothetical protein ACFYX8_01545 [Streptomyces cyaneofuscatus]|uniref:hypothetical protein n=1 Tax=Streptomyces cyaneofuscatus TaxID=66883 RepID=UPI0036778EEB
MAFTVHYRLLDGDVVIEADTGSRTVSLAEGSVASFFEEFCDAAAELGVDRPRTTLVFVAFGDAVYQAAVDLAGWPADTVGLRVDGWYMSRTLPERVRAAATATAHRR